MARPRAAMPPSDAILALLDDAGRLTVRATPNARADAIQLPEPGAPAMLAVRVTATPEDGKANDAILALLARALGVAPSRLTLVRGDTARIKQVQVDR